MTEWKRVKDELPEIDKDVRRLKMTNKQTVVELKKGLEEIREKTEEMLAELMREREPYILDMGDKIHLVTGTMIKKMTEGEKELVNFMLDGPLRHIKIRTHCDSSLIGTNVSLVFQHTEHMVKFIMRHKLEI